MQTSTRVLVFSIAGTMVASAFFGILNEIVAAESGGVVKTIGDAVMATFPTPDRAMSAAPKMRGAFKDLLAAARARTL